jgi:hypothetical protein
VGVGVLQSRPMTHHLLRAMSWFGKSSAPAASDKGQHTTGSLLPHTWQMCFAPSRRKSGPARG